MSRGVRLVRQDLVAAGYSAAANLVLNEKIKHWMEAGRKVYHMAFGQSPFPVMDFALKALQRHAGENAYLDTQGLLSLRQGICRFHAKFDDVDIDPSQVIVAPGSKELIFHLLHVFEGNVLLLSPSWTTYRPQALLARHKPISLTTTMDSDWKLTPKLLEQVIAANSVTGPSLLIMTNPCNPTGTSYSEQDLASLSAVFRKNDVIVLSDEIYARLRYDQGHCSLAKVYPEGTVVSTGLSKWASAGGWRLGYHVYPKELAALMSVVRSAASHTYTSAPAPVQRAAVEIFQNEAGCDEYIRHTTRIMAAVAEDCFRELTSVGVKMVKPTGGYYMFPDFEVVREALKKRGVNTSEDMCALMLEECGVAVMAGGPAFLRPETELTTRLCFVNFDGALALRMSEELGLQRDLPQGFVQNMCCPLVEGIQALKTWVQTQLKQ